MEAWIQLQPIDWSAGSRAGCAASDGDGAGGDDGDGADDGDGGRDDDPPTESHS